MDSTPLDDDGDGERAPNTFVNGLIGAAISVLLGFIPFSPILGGGVAGFLEGGDSGDGAKVGVISGILAALPLAIVVFIGFAVFTTIPDGGAIGPILFILAFLTVVVAYTVILSIIGGVIGVYLKNEV